MLKKRFFPILFFMFSLFSCHQDPLKNIPDGLKEGVLHTGEQHLPLFENAFYERLLKLNIQDRQGRPENNITFKEGEKASYVIFLRPLYNLESRYEINVKGNPFSHLKGSKWSFDKEKREGIFEWTPEKTFTGRNFYIGLSLPLLVEFKSQRGGDSSFTIERNIEVIVQKTLDKPEVYKIGTKYRDYERLEDGLFYTNYGAKFLNLQYDKIFLDKKREKELKQFEHLRFYSREALSKNQARLQSQYGVDDLYDERGQPIPYPLLFFIKQPLYYPIDKERFNENCDLGPVSEEDKSFCLSKIDSKANRPFDTNIYIRQYQIPETLNIENLFYKIEEKNLCGTYGRMINPYINEEEPEVPCYLSLSLFSAVNQDYIREDKKGIYNYLDQNRLAEEGDIYQLLKDGSFQLVDVSQWELKFYKVPNFIKWQISGHQAVENNLLNIILAHGYSFDDLKVYVKDYNFLEESPSLVVHKKLEDSLFWPFPYLKKWIVKSAEKLGETAWRLNYDLDIDVSRDSDEEESFQYFQAHFRVDSKEGISSAPFSLSFSILPPVEVSYVDMFDPERDVQLSETVTATKGVKEWKSSILSLSHQVKAHILFPLDFLSEVKSFIFPKTLSLRSYFHLGKTSLDYIDIFPKHVNSCTDLEKEKGPRDLSKGSYCRECSDFIEKSKANGQVYFEKICSYELNILANQENLKKPIQYFPYDYKAPSIRDIKLDNTFYEKNETSDIPIKIIPEHFKPLYQKSKEQRVSNGNRIDVFFNLQPSLGFLSRSEEMKQYRVSYPVYAKDGKPLVDPTDPFDENAFMKVTFEKGETGRMQAYISCRNETNKPASVSASSMEYTPACFCEDPVFSANSLDIDCQFPLDQRDFSVYLQTEDPYIYFLNTDPLYSGDYKRTPVKTFLLE